MSAEIRRVAQVLLSQRAFDNEPDAVRAAILVLAAADSVSRADGMARQLSAASEQRPGETG